MARSAKLNEIYDTIIKMSEKEDEEEIDKDDVEETKMSYPKIHSSCSLCVLYHVLNIYSVY